MQATTRVRENRDGRVREFQLELHLYAKAITNGFEVTKAGKVPAVAVGVPLSNKDGPQTLAEEAELRGIPHRDDVGAPMWRFP